MIKIYNTTKGFSLVEILIVIAIMAILFAVMMPNLLQSRNRANDTSTMHYLRAVAIKQADYYMDYSTYADEQTLLTDLVVDHNLVIESWQGSAGGFCVQAKHVRGESYKVNASSQVVKGNCT